jgi:alanine dehydrogenase
VEEGVVHYCVGNMPGSVPVTATAALTAATLPYIREIAAKGPRGAILANAALAKGVLVSEGHVIHSGLAQSLGVSAAPLA